MKTATTLHNLNPTKIPKIKGASTIVGDYFNTLPTSHDDIGFTLVDITSYDEHLTIKEVKEKLSLQHKEKEMLRSEQIKTAQQKYIGEYYITNAHLHHILEVTDSFIITESYQLSWPYTIQTNKIPNDELRNLFAVMVVNKTFLENIII